MNRYIFALTLGLAIAFGWGHAAIAQKDTAMADGEAKAAAGDIKGAIAHYEKATVDDPESFEAFARLGGMQLMDQRYSDAVRSFQRAISLGDDSARPFIGMGMAYLHMGQLGPARAALVEAQGRNPNEPAQIDKVIAWIDSRAPQRANPH